MNTTVNKQLQRVNFAINQHRTLIVFYRECKVNDTDYVSSAVRHAQSIFLPDITYKLTAPITLTDKTSHYLDLRFFAYVYSLSKMYLVLPHSQKPQCVSSNIFIYDNCTLK